MGNQFVVLAALICHSLFFLNVAYAQTGSAPTNVAPTSVQSGLLISKVNPTYPPLARQARVQGAVVLDVVIGTDGSVNSATVVSGHPMLVPAGIEAVKKWKYPPYVLDGRPVEVRTPVTVQFTLEGEPAAQAPQAQAEEHKKAHVDEMSAPPQVSQQSGTIGIVLMPKNEAPVDESKLVVATVIEGGPCDKAGVKPGDTIYSVDGRVLSNAIDLQTALKTRTIGSTIKLGYRRQGKQFETLVTIADREKLYSDWYLKRAEQGDADAEYNLGTMYYVGYGRPQDYRLAYQWYSKAAEQGEARSLCAIGTLYSEGKGVPQDFQAGMKWWTKAAEAGNLDAQDNLGLAYSQGKGVTQDYQQAVLWFTRAAQQGHARAQSHLASMYYQGNGASQDYKQAMQWYTKAAEQGHAPAQLFLGEMYANGQGVQQDFQQAREWYNKAAQQGDSNAKAALARLDTAETVAAAEKTALTQERLSLQEFSSILQRAEEARAKADFPENLKNLGFALADALKLYPKLLKNAPRFLGRDNGATSLLERIQDLSGRLGKDLTPRNSEDVRSMLSVFRDCHKFALNAEAARDPHRYSSYDWAPISDIVQEIAATVFARTHRNVDVLEKDAEGYALPTRDSNVAAIDQAIREMQDAEHKLDNGDYSGASANLKTLSTFSFLHEVPPAPLGSLSPNDVASLLPVLREYVEQTAKLQQDLNAYVEAKQLNRGTNITLLQLANNVVREQELLKSAQSNPLTKVWLANVLASDSAELKRRVDFLTPFHVEEASYALPPELLTTSAANAQQKAQFLREQLAELDSKLTAVADVKTMSTQPQMTSLVSQQLGDATLTELRARYGEIVHVEGIRQSVATDLTSVQAQIEQYAADARALAAAKQVARVDPKAPPDSASRATARQQYARDLEGAFAGVLAKDPNYDPSLVSLHIYTGTPTSPQGLRTREQYRLNVETNSIVLPRDITGLLRKRAFNSDPYNLGFKEVMFGDSIEERMGAILCAVELKSDGAHPLYCMRMEPTLYVGNVVGRGWQQCHVWNNYVVRDKP